MMNVDLRLPFEYKTPFRYLIVLGLEYIFATNTIFIASMLLCFGLSLYLFELLFAKQINAMLQKFGENAKTKAHRATPSHIKQLSDYIQFHSSVKELRKFMTRLVSQTNIDTFFQISQRFQCTL